MVQLYVGDRESTAIRPVRELKGFEKVLLQPGESRDVSFPLDKRSFAVWDQELHDWYVETGDFTVEAGFSSRDLRQSACVRVESTAKKKRHYDFNSIFLDFMNDPEAMAAIKPYLSAVMGVLGEENHQDQSEAAKDAISEEMTLAMMKYTPLRGMLNGDHVTPELIAQLDALLKRLNSEA